ncbi:MAG: 2-amino-4-hydroxy-6-hydroxymethyldihydropteridine diphosphokinase [bacterium]
MKQAWNSAYLGLGSNIGNRIKNLEKALALLAAQTGIRVISTSSFYETEPVGFRDQGWFVNQVARIETTLPPLELLRVTQHIENSMGRTRAIRWGPRSIDIDILLYGDLVIDHAGLTIPHPRMTERRFVLVPLAEIDPSLRHPKTKERMRTILIDTPTNDLIQRI